MALVLFLASAFEKAGLMDVKKFSTAQTTIYTRSILPYFLSSLLLLHPLYKDWVLSKSNSHITCRALAVLRPCRFVSDFSGPWHYHGRDTALYAWINIGRSALLRFLPTTMRSFTIGSLNFSGYTRIFTQDTALSKHGMGTVRHVWISATRHGRDMAGARYGMCELALSPLRYPEIKSRFWSLFRTWYFSFCYRSKREQTYFLHADFVHMRSVQVIIFSGDKTIKNSWIVIRRLMAVASFISYGLEKKVERVDQCGKEWNLRCNLSKCKIMVFKKGGKWKATEGLNVNAQNIDKFTYLGVTLDDTGRWNKEKTLAKTKGHQTLRDIDKCILVKVKVKLSHYRPLGFLEVGVPEFLDNHEGCKVVSPKHRPSLLPGTIPGTYFC